MKPMTTWSGVGGVVVALSVALLAGCASQAPAPPAATGTGGSHPIDPPRSARGNPPFYDVLGRRYFVLASSNGYRERGVASWYGKDFHGLSTASGETYDMYEMTAAHKTLPIPTWVEVTNLKNDRRVIVKVNDRGPFVDDRLIDLSFKAAEALDIVGAGTAMVEVRSLGVPARAIPGTVEATTAAVTADGGGFGWISSATAATTDGAALPMYVQVGAYAEHGNAMAMLERLRANGFGDVRLATDETRRPPLHRVHVGPVRDADEFDRVNGRLRSIGIGSTQLIVEP
jgi:rare lipoprotein A